MDIKILQLIEGAKQARGLAVIIDVFRAFSFECYIMNQNADTIIPVGKKETAYKLKEEHPEYLLAGERHGAILERFDYGNSPAQIKGTDFTGKTIIHTTSAGTQGIDNAIQADQIMVASLVNAKAVAKYIKENHFKTVSLVCMGLEAKQETQEDTLCAQYIQCLLEDREMDIQKEAENLKHTSGKKFFDPNQQKVFLQEDFALCTKIDQFNFVLMVEEREDGLKYIRQVQV